MLRKVTLTLVVSLPLLADSFTPPCELRFADIAKRRAFDNVCGIEGKGTDPDKLLQNRAKNNFCAEGEPALTTFRTYKALQTLVEKPNVLGPNYNEPDTRDEVENIGYVTSEGDTIGEGSVVKLAAWVMEAHYSNATSGGEGVNCNMNGAFNNDLHIGLVSNKNETRKCRSLTAEIPPHFRPSIWGETIIHGLRKQRPVRITGHLLFDASHHPCTGDTPHDSLKRASSWEIHPVYNIEVCKFASLASCDADDDNDWITLEEFLNPAEESIEDDEDAHP